MNNNNFDSALALALKLEHVLIATADDEGVPHVAAALQLSRASENELTVSGWFCPGTMANLEHNRNISLVVWDAASDTGYQILGTVRKIEELAMMNDVMRRVGKSIAALEQDMQNGPEQ